jgi:hypothetical protein
VLTASFVALRMPFGGSPNPSLWSDVSEVVTDLANDLVRRSDWDPTRHHSPHQPLLESDRAKDDHADGVLGREGFMCPHFFAPNYLIEDILSRFDCYLDDIFGAFYGCDKARSAAAIPMALHIVGRPNDTSNGDSFPRDKLLSLSKFLAEAKPAQRKIVLGWLVDTRAFVVKLPGKKQRRWSEQIDDLLCSGRRPVQAKDLATLLGRLNNASCVIPYARHFTDRLYGSKGSYHSLRVTVGRPGPLETFPPARSGGDLDQSPFVQAADANRESGRMPPRNTRVLPSEQNCQLEISAA